MRITIRTCQKCGKEFQIENWRLNDKTKNRGLFCSVLCKNKYYSGEKSPFFGTNKTEENNPNWKGDNVGYFGLHLWVISLLGKPDTCEHCGRTNLSGKLIDWANKDHKYKRVITDWIRLCRSCHHRYDYQLRKINEQI